MKWFAETTEWADAKSNNHIYLLDDSKSKMFAYVKHGQGCPKSSANPFALTSVDASSRSIPNSTKLTLRLRCQKDV
jgi:hypothetical protein